MLHNHLASSKFLINISQDCCSSEKFSLIKLTKEMLFPELSHQPEKVIFKTCAARLPGIGSVNFLTREALSWNIALLKDYPVSITADTPFPLSVHS